jgi:hypothetical protein
MNDASDDLSEPDERPGRPSIALAIRPDQIEHTPEKITWETVTLTNAALPALLRFAAWHLELGATKVSFYLDQDMPDVERFFAPHPRVAVIPCSPEWWASIGRERLPAHQNRQAVAATQAYRSAQSQWLCHIDIDEFLLPDTSIADWLATAPDDMAVLNIAPIEQLAPTEPGDTYHFKMAPRFAGQTGALRESLYPTFGPYLRGGYISHLEGKNFARTGFKALRVGIHSCFFQQKAIANRTRLPGVWLGHAHAPSWESFARHLAFRKTQGSYRPQKSGNIGLAQLLDMLESEGENGLKALFKEVCLAHPDLLAALAAHNMLVTRQMPFDTLIQKHFGVSLEDLA